MEINIEHEVVKSAWEIMIEQAWGVKITSIDKEDFGKTYKIGFDDVTSVEEGYHYDYEEKQYTLWWRQWNPIEGKFMTMSAAFQKHSFIPKPNGTQDKKD